MAQACILWGLCTVLIGLSRGVTSFALLCVINGSVLVSMKPISQSVAADISQPEERGRLFAVLEAVAQVGPLLMAAVGAPASQMVFFGVSGWRVVFVTMGIISAAYALLVLALFKDPRPQRSLKYDPLDKDQSLAETAASIFETMRVILKCKTWALISLQGIFGSIPYTALSFFPMYLQYMGFSAGAAGTIISFTMLGKVAGCLIAGAVGDWASVKSPDCGRILTAVFADACRPVVLVVLLTVLPQTQNLFIEEHFTATYCGVVALLGFLMPWPSVACGRPICAEIVPANMRASVIAYEYVIERIFGSLGSLGVGWSSMALFGYNAEHGHKQIEQLTAFEKHENAQALGTAMLYLTVVPWILCTLLYSLVILTYKHDRDRACCGHDDGHWAAA
eukprot:gnl/TRDRNA2_/TRDRNA2_84180_c1_seq1.p1 gnl/TRDRNA2_/TRDRNA2_84180_c1~~gnl/TRDRNA2_/TRDRNA2_84180_c1_seq1.p1  ORF type:complete len:405 (+),score=56.48 gnl/TRDRNA2_/TRDRNA2_84180_c1_seq1:39-1217(+)